jgi:hypothetical protein
MSSSDVDRLEAALQRELALTREMSKTEHDHLRDELAKLDAKIDGIAERLNTVEDDHALQRAHQAGKSQGLNWIGRLCVQLVSTAAVVIGCIYLVGDHLK